jgi:hypothetical protein
MTALQHSIREVLSKHRFAGWWLMFCVVFTFITLLEEALRFCDVIPNSVVHSTVGRIGLAAFVALVALLGSRRYFDPS